MIFLLLAPFAPCLAANKLSCWIALLLVQIQDKICLKSFMSTVDDHTIEECHEQIIQGNDSTHHSGIFFFLNRNYFNYFNRTSTIELLFIKNKTKQR